MDMTTKCKINLLSDLSGNMRKPQTCYGQMGGRADGWEGPFLLLQRTNYYSSHWYWLTYDVWSDNVLTTHLLSVERVNWPKLHDMFKARDAKVWQREFPVWFLVEVSALNSTFIKIFHDLVARIESKCVIKTKHVLLVCSFVRFCAGKTALALTRPTKHVFSTYLIS